MERPLERRLHVVLRTGPLGLAVASHLAARGDRVRAANRAGRADLPSGVEVVSANVAGAADATRACDGAAVVYHCANPPYAKWPDLHPPLMDAVIEAAGAAGARVVFGDNLYAYGQPTVHSPRTCPTVLDGTADDGAAALSAAVAAARENAGFPTLEIQVGKPGLPRLAFVGPLGGKVRTVKLDLAVIEHVESVERRTIRAGIWDDLPEASSFDVYPLGEITAEKLRCIIQRVQCRDLYDLMRLTEDLKVELRDIRSLFESKTRIKGLDPASFAEKFEDRVARYKNRWDREMGEHLAGPPRLEDVIRIVSRRLRAADLI